MAIMQLRLVLGCFTSRDALARRRSTYVGSTSPCVCCVGLQTQGSKPRVSRPLGPWFLYPLDWDDSQNLKGYSKYLATVVLNTLLHTIVYTLMLVGIAALSQFHV